MLKNTLDHKLDFRRKLTKPNANLYHYAAEVSQMKFSFHKIFKRCAILPPCQYHFLFSMATFLVPQTKASYFFNPQKPLIKPTNKNPFSPQLHNLKKFHYSLVYLTPRACRLLGQQMVVR